MSDVGREPAVNLPYPPLTPPLHHSLEQLQVPSLAHRPSPGPNTPASTEEEPMQLGRARLSPNERFWRIKAGECIYCGQTDHFLASCPHQPKEQAHQ